MEEVEMNILLTGSEGQLGKELQKQLTEKKFDFTAVDLPEVDISKYSDIQNIITEEKPDIIINSAANNDVDGCEDNEELAFKVNAIGPRNLALMAAKVDAKFVHISTDYVFAGDAVKPYREYDNTCPQTVYGKSKLMGEEFVHRHHKKHFIIRTAWLYGEGKNFVRTMLRLAENRDEINVVDDQFGSPTSTVDLAKVIIKLMQTEYYGLYHGTCEGLCSWYDFACKIFELKKQDIIINRVSSEEFKSPAPRPSYSVLDNFMLSLHNLNLFRNWEEALAEYIKEGVKEE